MIAYIDASRGEFAVEPICRVLQFAPSTYWSVRRRAPSARSARDAQLKAEIARVHAENFGVYGAPKVWVQLNRRGTQWRAAPPGAVCAATMAVKRHECSLR